MIISYVEKEDNRSLGLSFHNQPSIDEAVTTSINWDIMPVLTTSFRLCPFESSTLKGIKSYVKLTWAFIGLVTLFKVICAFSMVHVK